MQSSRHTVIQPVSSEEAIRQAATSAAPSLPSPTASSSPSQADEFNGSTLVTEPLHSASAQQATGSTRDSRQLHTSLAHEEQPKKSKGPLFGMMGLIVLLGVGAVAWLLFFNGRINTSDLVEVNVQNTTYLRPKQWSQVNSSATSR